MGFGLSALVAAASLASPAGVQAEDTPQSGGYLVVELALRRDDDPFTVAAREVATEVAAYHRGRVVAFDGEDWGAWRTLLRGERPEQVLFLVPPDILDLPLHRRILLASADLDADPLPDFTWGYLTARDGDGLRALWERTLRVHEHGLKGATWYDVAVTSGMKSRVYPGSVPPLAAAAGFEGDSIYFATVDQDADNLDFVDAQLPRLQEAAVIEFTGNGDPEGIWLFPGARNLDRSLHWPFAPERVGEDPDGVMPRVTAEFFAGLRLQTPVIWSGTCHSAATGRVYVEGDIVSTFGRTEHATLYRMPPERSLCLAMIDAGAVAFLAPIGANHGMAVSRERDAVLTRGCTLGEAVKSTWDDVFLAAGGPPPLDLPIDGAPHRRGEAVMQGGGSNRILIGDPALRPFAVTPHPTEDTRIASVEGGLDVRVSWQPGWHPTAWDMYGGTRDADWRVIARVPLTGLVPIEAPVPDWSSIEVEAVDPDGEPLPYVLRHAVVEDWRGERWLHLQANAPRDGVQRRGVTATFRLRR